MGHGIRGAAIQIALLQIKKDYPVTETYCLNIRDNISGKGEQEYDAQLMNCAYGFLMECFDGNKKEDILEQMVEEGYSITQDEIEVAVEFENASKEIVKNINNYIGGYYV